MAGFWSQILSGLAPTSSANSIVAAGRFAKATNDEFVYAEPTTVTPAGVRLVSFIEQAAGIGIEPEVVVRVARDADLVDRRVEVEPDAVADERGGVVSNAGPSATAIAVQGLTR